jgi:hypothetical protein
VLEVAYRSKIIIFEPSFTSYKQEILSLVDMLKDAVTKVPRIETVLAEKLGLPPLSREKVFLKASAERVYATGATSVPSKLPICDSAGALTNFTLSSAADHPRRYRAGGQANADRKLGRAKNFA